MHNSAHHAMDTTLVVSIPCTIVYSMRHEKLFFLFQQRVARRLASEQVVSVMDELYDNNIPSDRNDEGLQGDDSETETDELHQLSTISCTLSLIAWCAQ